MKTGLKKQRKLIFQFRYCFGKNELMIVPIEVPELSKPCWQVGYGEKHDLAKLLCQIDGIVSAYQTSSASFSIEKSKSHKWRAILPKARSVLKKYYEAEVVEEVRPYRPHGTGRLTVAQADAMSKAMLYRLDELG